MLLNCKNYISVNLEENLISMNNTVDFADTLCKIKEDCVLEFGGSLVHNYIHILVNDYRNKLTNIKSFI